MQLSVHNILWKKVNIEPLVWFRIIFGCLMLVSTVRFWYNGWIESLFIDPTFFFTYYGFDWVSPLEGNGMYWVFGIMLLSTILIILGLFYRIATVLFFLLFTYVELIDKTNYLNHYYFVSLIAFLLCLVPAHRYFSLDVKLRIAKPKKFTPAWCVNIIKFQIGCVYFFAGIAKLNPHWLFEAQPLTNWLKHQTDFPLIGGLMKYEATAFIYSWVGCVFDLSVAFLLLFRSTRLWAYIMIVVFHTITGLMFPIGVFPIVMIALTTVFFSPQLFVRLFDKLSGKKPMLTSANVSIKKNGFSLLIWCYVILQILIPMRYLLYPGKLFWSEQGYRFSWRVMLIEKVGNVTFYIQPEHGDAKKTIELENYLTPQQIKQMCTQPDMILQFAHHLRDEYKDSTIKEEDKFFEMGTPQIFVDAYANLFNSGSKKLIDSKINLSKIPYNLENRTWITQYE